MDFGVEICFASTYFLLIKIEVIFLENSQKGNIT